MKQIWAGQKFIWQRRWLPPKEFYVQFRTRKGALDLYQPKSEELEITLVRPKLKGGGQKAQRKETGVEIRHVPTNLRVHCSDSRQPEANEQLAMLQLRYLLDKKFNPNGRAAEYERTLPEVLDKLKESEKAKFNQDRDEARDRAEAELMRRREAFKIEPYHVLGNCLNHSNESLVVITLKMIDLFKHKSPEQNGRLLHIPTDISVDSSLADAREILRQRVAAVMI